MAKALTKALAKALATAVGLELRERIAISRYPEIAQDFSQKLYGAAGLEQEACAL